MLCCVVLCRYWVQLKQGLRDDDLGVDDVCARTRFFQNLIQASEDNDVEALSQHCFEYDEVWCR